MKKLSLILLFFLLAPGCARVYDPVSGREVRTLYSERQEIELGRRISEAIREDVEICEESSLELDRIGRLVAEHSDRPHIPYEFAVIKADDINAFALPGGFVFMYSGLLDMLDEDEVAAVLGHEIAHIVARHGIKRMQAVLGYQFLSIAGLIAMKDNVDPAAVHELSDTVFTLIMLGYSRRDELEADRLGTRYAINAGFDPRGMLGVLEKFEEMQRGVQVITFLNTHPPIRERIREVNIVISSMERSLEENANNL